MLHLTSFCQIKPIPVSKTLTLVNNFVANTTVFFNNFTEIIEKKISKVSNKITEVEILLAVLEAKLNSVPGLENIDAKAAATAPQAVPKPTEPPVSSATPAPPAPVHLAVSSSPPPPDTASGGKSGGVPEPEVEEVKAPSLADDPDYAQFIRLLKVGVPMFVVQAKATAAGLDPSKLEPFAP